MDTKTNEQVIAGLDVGSSQVTTVLGRKTQDGVEILGMGECPTEGMRRGAVVNVDATVKSIRQSVTEAERMTGLTVESVYVGISGPLIKSFNSHAAISVKNEHEVTDADFTRSSRSPARWSFPTTGRSCTSSRRSSSSTTWPGSRTPGE